MDNAIDTPIRGERRRIKVDYYTAKDALAAAEGNYPLDFMLIVNGHKDTRQSYVRGASELEATLEERGFGKTRGDKIMLWLPVTVDDLLGAS